MRWVSGTALLQRALAEARHLPGLRDQAEHRHQRGRRGGLHAQCRNPHCGAWKFLHRRPRPGADRLSNITVAEVGPEAAVNIHNPSPAPCTPNWSALTGPTAPPLPAMCWPCRCTMRTSPPPSPPASWAKGRGHASAETGAHHLVETLTYHSHAGTGLWRRILYLRIIRYQQRAKLDVFEIDWVENIAAVLWEP
jgi:hypothetical protein